MGSRAVVVVCRDEETAVKRFGVEGEGIGIVYTRTGRRFFNAAAWEGELLARVRDALEARGFWKQLGTDWVCLDAELMPWSAKAQALLLQQYGPTGAAARVGLKAAVEALERAEARGVSTGKLRERHEGRLRMATAYSEAYRLYCWPVASVDDFRLAPFHVLATEGAVHADKDHDWHMRIISVRLLGERAGREGVIQRLFERARCFAKELRIGLIKQHLLGRRALPLDQAQCQRDAIPLGQHAQVCLQFACSKEVNPRYGDAVGVENLLDCGLVYLREVLAHRSKEAGVVAMESAADRPLRELLVGRPRPAPADRGTGCAPACCRSRAAGG